MSKTTKNKITTNQFTLATKSRRKYLRALLLIFSYPFSRIFAAESTSSTNKATGALLENLLNPANPAALNSPAAEKLTLNQIKFINFSHEQQSFPRISLISNGKLSYDYLLLSNPARLVIDLKNLYPTDDLSKKLPLLNEKEQIIKSLRIARYKPEIIRFVAELKIDSQILIYQDLSNKAITHLDFASTSVAPLPIRRSEEIRLVSLNTTLASKTTTEAANPTSSSNPPPTNQANDNNANNKNNDDNSPEENKASSKRYGRSSRLIIAVDAGHGGIDPGAVGREGTKEKNITLALAQLMVERLEKEHPIKVILTRHNDTFVALGDRVQKARKARAELFISLHADAWIKPDARGSSVFVLSEKAASSSAARWLAKIQNEVDVLGGVNIAIRDQVLAKTILDLSQSATKVDSMRFAKFVIKEVAKINRLHRGFVEYANFAVLKAPDIPSILFETAFISNPEEEQLLKDEQYRAKICNSLSNGIEAYFSKNVSNSNKKSPPGQYNQKVSTPSLTNDNKSSSPSKNNEKSKVINNHDFPFFNYSG